MDRGADLDGINARRYTGFWDLRVLGIQRRLRFEGSRIPIERSRFLAITIIKHLMGSHAMSSIVIFECKLHLVS